MATVPGAGDHAEHLSEKPRHTETGNSSQTKLESADDEHHETVAPKASKHAQFDPNTLASKLEKEERHELTEDECYDELGFRFPTWKKWMILSIIFIVQVSMNFNTSLYSNALTGISEEFHVSMQAARCGAMVFLVLYAFGCELWAPWSEELGRKPVLQASLFLVNIFQLPVALAHNFGTVMAGRALGGLSSAGGSVTLGMIADMWESDDQQYAVAFVVFSSVGGSVLGPVVGGFVEAFLPWRWCIWIQLIFGGFVQLLHLFLVPETRTTVLMDRIAKKRRAAGGPNSNVWGPTEGLSYKERFPPKEIIATWIRPFKMFLTEPIVLTLSLLSGFSDALIFMFIQSFSLVYKQYGFGTVELGLSFLPILVGYFIAWIAFIPFIRRNIRQRAEKPDDEQVQYESRLFGLLFMAPCLPLGLIGFAWTIQPQVPWIASMIFAALIGIANYSIYMATIDYMICAYGPYSASATGGNGWSRDFLAGVLTIPATPFFTNIPGRPLEYANTILACISFVLIIAVYVIYWKGPALRKRSPFAEQLKDRNAVQTERDHKPLSRHPSITHPATPGQARPLAGRSQSYSRAQQEARLRQATGSRHHSGFNSRSNSQPGSAAVSRQHSLERINRQAAENV
ncbi:hypothetical protein BP6252_11795 [Coleophoma cylindrospora]|uniref:Major facilitator superfamily (MFS) profile domain-containing protein n=1 Tax=Coleophoma cylindrospora TaxID=1849047 RepID=A0A3D8QKP0_9HELO|nr:hypothetical protein BP6252_11795 [Coleophoma cylindrospora]